MRVLHINSYYQTGAFYIEPLRPAGCAGRSNIRVYAGPKGFDPAGRDFGPYAAVDPNHLKWDRLFFHLKQHKMLRGALKRYSPGAFDVLHAHSLLTNGGIAYSLHRRSGIPYIVAVRDTDVNVLLKRMPHLRPLARRILKHASKVIFLSSSYRDRALAPYLSREEQAEVPAKSAVVPNGIDALWLKDRPAPREAANPPRRSCCRGPADGAQEPARGHPRGGGARRPGPGWSS